MERYSVCIQPAIDIQSRDRGKMTKPECSHDEKERPGDLEKQQQDARAAANLPR